MNLCLCPLGRGRIFTALRPWTIRSVGRPLLPLLNLYSFRLGFLIFYCSIGRCDNFTAKMNEFVPLFAYRRTYHQRDGSDGIYFNCLCYSWISPSVSTKNNTFFTITDPLRGSTYISTSITKQRSTAPDGALFACMVFCIIRHLRCPTRCIANMAHLLVSCRISP